MDRDPQAAFDTLLGAVDYPMFVVTAAAGDERGGCLVGFATQCSIDPARFLVCVSKRNHTFGIAVRADVLAVHFLARDLLPLARLFGEETGDAIDKFARCDWRPGPHGVPILSRCRGWIAGRVLERLDAGDHVAFLLEPIAGEAHDVGADQLGFQDVRALQPGHDA